MPAIAATVRSTAASLKPPVRSSPSPSRVISARSATVRHAPVSPRSATWNLTEFVPMSSTANRRPTSAFSPRATHVFARASRPSSRTVAHTRAASSPSTTIVRMEPASVASIESSAMQPPML